MTTIERIREVAERLAKEDPLEWGPPFTGSPPSTRMRARAATRQNVGRELLAILDAKEEL